jgi:hypothetical protein
MDRKSLKKEKMKYYFMFERVAQFLDFPHALRLILCDRDIAYRELTRYGEIKDTAQILTNLQNVPICLYGSITFLKNFPHVRVPHQLIHKTSHVTLSGGRFVNPQPFSSITALTIKKKARGTIVVPNLQVITIFEGFDFDFTNLTPHRLVYKLNEPLDLSKDLIIMGDHSTPFYKSVKIIEFDLAPELQVSVSDVTFFLNLALDRFINIESVIIPMISMCNMSTDLLFQHIERESACISDDKMYIYF